MIPKKIHAEKPISVCSGLYSYNDTASISEYITSTIRMSAERWKFNKTGVYEYNCII